jgi:hypothetical protein
MFVYVTTNHIEVSSGKLDRAYLYKWYVLYEASIDTSPYIIVTEE